MAGWIHVKTERPEKHKPVLVCYRGVFGHPVMAVAMWNGQRWMIDRQVMSGTGTLNFVRYWMPLPEAPADWAPDFWPEDGHDERTGLFRHSPKIVYSEQAGDKLSGVNERG
jgi:hypothetical protein